MQRYEIFLAPPNTIASNFYEISRLDYVDYVKRICTHADSKCPLNSYQKSQDPMKNPKAVKGWIHETLMAIENIDTVTRTVQVQDDEDVHRVEE